MATILKYGAERDKVAEANNNLIVSEMEGSWVRDIYPAIVIKSVCNYADSHKNEEWQIYAVASAAAGLKAFPQELELANDAGPSSSKIYQ